MRNKKIGITLVVITILIYVFFTVNDNEDAEKSSSFLDLKAEKENVDMLDIKEGYEMIDNKNYFKNKKANYRIAMFFNNLKNEKPDSVKLFPEYISFLNITPSEYTKSKYKLGDTILYEIIDIERKNDYGKDLIKIKWKYEDKENFSYKTFSLDNSFILDEPFLYIKEINKATEFKEISLLIEAKAVFNDREVYKIKIRNEGKDTFIIDDDKYGFYAIQDKNKYYHNMEQGNMADYRIHPNTENTLYITFNNLRGKAEVYMKMNDNSILLLSN